MQPFCQRRQRRHLVADSQSHIFEAMLERAARLHILILTPAAHCVNVELERQQKLPEGTLAQLTLVEHIYVEGMLFGKSPEGEESALGVVVIQFCPVKIIDRRFDAVELLCILRLQTHRPGA